MGLSENISLHSYRRARVEKSEEYANQIILVAFRVIALQNNCLDFWQLFVDDFECSLNHTADSKVVLLVAIIQNLINVDVDTLCDGAAILKSFASKEDEQAPMPGHTALAEVLLCGFTN